MDPIVITHAKRTAIGSFQGSLSSLTAPELGSTVVKACTEGLSVPVDAVIMGNVLSAGLGQAPARQATLNAGLPLNTDCTTINKMCGSGLKAVMLAHDLILADCHHIIIAGGMESMSNAPYLLPKVRSGLRLGHHQTIDHMFLDGLEDAYDKGRLMGTFAEDTAEKYGFTRELQDDFAIESLKRAQHAIQQGFFKAEIVPVVVASRQGDSIIDEDESPKQAKIDKIPVLKPAFRPNGTVTAANSSSISDGASAQTIMRQSEAEKLGLPILARIVGHSSFSQEPGWFTTAPTSAIQLLLQKINWSIDEVDLFEINEAFAVVTLSSLHDLNIPREKVNIHGGACALGHPIGASGSRILSTLIYALKQNQLKRGIASLCIGGGEAVAIAIEI